MIKSAPDNSLKSPYLVCHWNNLDLNFTFCFLFNFCLGVSRGHFQKNFPLKRALELKVKINLILVWN